MSDPPEDFSTLIPELPRWDNGAGIGAEDWIGCVGNYELAVGYSLVFWPRFRRYGRYIFVESDSVTNAYIESWEKACSGDRQSIEAAVNHLHVADLHCNVVPSESQLRYLGRTLRAIYETKLKADFPGTAFEVVFNDEPDLDLLDYELTFWQATDRPRLRLQDTVSG